MSDGRMLGRLPRVREADNDIYPINTPSGMWKRNILDFTTIVILGSGVAGFILTLSS